MKRTVAVFAFALISTAALAGVGSRNVLYVGGTVPGVAENAEGVFDTSNDAQLSFRAERTSAVIPYSSITSLEYGQGGSSRGRGRHGQPDCVVLNKAEALPDDHLQGRERQGASWSL